MYLNPSDAEVAYVQCTRTQKYKNHPNYAGIHRKALVEYYQMSTREPGFQSFPSFCNLFILMKLATSSERVIPFMSVAPKNGLIICVISLL